jgi:hypothetical protein
VEPIWECDKEYYDFMRDILELRSDYDGLLALYVHGHVNQIKFLDAVVDYSFELDIEIDDRPVKHEYWRWVPTRDDFGYFGSMAIRTDKAGRGAFPVTIIDIEPWG